MLKKTYMYNDVTIVEMPASMLRVVWLDREKRTGGDVTRDGNFCNANFFGYYEETGIEFRLPAGHLKCDIYPGFQLHSIEEHYMHERGKISDDGGKFTFDSGKWEYMNPCYGHAPSTLFIENGKATIVDTEYLAGHENADYAISGVPVLRNGDDVSFYNYVLAQGWTKDTVRAAYHVFVGVKDDPSMVYVMYYQSKTGNLIYGMEFFNQIKGAGFRDIIKLDGGGSFIFKCPDLGNSKLTSTTRVIDAVLTFDEPIEEPNPDVIDKAEVMASIEQLQAKTANLSRSLYDINRYIAELNTEIDTLKKKLQ